MGLGAGGLYWSAYFPVWSIGGSKIKPPPLIPNFASNLQNPPIPIAPAISSWQNQCWSRSLALTRITRQIPAWTIPSFSNLGMERRVAHKAGKEPSFCFLRAAEAR